MQKSLPRSTPESQGVSSPSISAFIDATEKKKLGLHSLMIVRHGQVVAEGWWDPYGAQYRHVLYSLSKSFTSTAAGLAASEGYFNLNDKVISFFPDQAPANPSKNLAAMRIRDLLCMGTGHEKDTVAGSDRQKDDWVSAFLEQPVEHEPGTHFLYNSGATYMVSAIVQKATGQKVIDFLTPRLFEPLGIEDPVWEVCPRGVNTGGWGLSIRTEDIAKFGQLYLQDGIWEGKRLLPEGWVADASAKHISNGTDPNNDWNQGYGYQFWRTRHGLYRGDGAFGQYCIVMPKQDGVIAVTSGSTDMGGIMNLMWDHLLPAMKTDTLPEDSPAQEKLARRLNSLVMPFPEGKPSSRLVEEISGRTYTFPENDQTLESAALTAGDGTAEITFRNSCGDQKITAGFGKWVRGETRLTTKHPLKVAASYAWPKEDTFELQICFYESPTIMTTTCRYAGNEVICNSKINVSFGPTDKPPLIGRRS
jgi:CubicO group peptidase (beta-lactamase class C family)